MRGSKSNRLLACAPHVRWSHRWFAGSSEISSGAWQAATTYAALFPRGTGPIDRQAAWSRAELVCAGGPMASAGASASPSEAALTVALPRRQEACVTGVARPMAVQVAANLVGDEPWARHDLPSVLR